MATRVRIEGPHNGNQWVIVAPDVRIPFRGTRTHVNLAASAVAKIMSTAFFDVELTLVPNPTAGRALRRPRRTPPRRR